MRVVIVYHEKSWIMEAFAKDYYRRLKQKSQVKCVSLHNGYSEIPDDLGSDDCVFHINYFFAKKVKNTKNIVLITHIDSRLKMFLVSRLARQSFSFVCMSNETKVLVEHISCSSSVISDIPRSLHFDRAENPITFGLFFRIYPDDRKNLKLIKELNQIALSSERVRLIIYGSGFESIFDHKKESILYDSSGFNKDKYYSYLSQCDFVVYYGNDEGAVSILDASTLNIKVLSTNQGYHKDIPIAPGSYLFPDGESINRYVKRLLISESPDNLVDFISSESTQVPIFKFIQSFISFLVIKNKFILKTSVFRQAKIIYEYFKR